jgi:hypothetical protein
MSGQGFWKPGDIRPNKSGDDDRKSITPQRSILPKNPSNDDAALPSNALNQANNKDTTTPIRKTKLSGTTMNMRFMMRKQQHQQDVLPSPPSSHHQERITTTTPKSAPTSQVDTLSRDRQQQHLESSILPVADESVYINILGRRSFGGFNRHVESTWDEHTTFYKTAVGRHIIRGGNNSNNNAQEETKKKRKRHSK